MIAIQTSKRPTLHKTFVLYEKLCNNLENVKAIFENMSTVPEQFEEVRLAINNRWTKIKIHYIKTKNPPAYVDANILHPGKKLHLFKNKGSSFTERPNQVEIYEKSGPARFDKLYNNSAPSKLTVKPSNSLKCKRAMDSDDSDNSDDDYDNSHAYNKFDHYLHIKRDRTVKDIKFIIFPLHNRQMVLRIINLPRVHLRY